ncbi:MAG: DNA primase [Solirubrobacteraceae bacterium]
MTRYVAGSRDRVLDAVDMVALVGGRVELRRAGVNSYFGLCPFHDEQTASFHVSPDERLYHCFGCQASGDAFDFVMATEGLEFKAALEALADQFGVALETEAEAPEATARRARRDRLQSLLGRAAEYYARYLWHSGEAQSAREYLLGRRLSEQTLREFGVGYAPAGWRRMLAASRQAGFTDAELLEAGLMQRSRTNPGEAYGYFRGRIVFPARDARGRVIGFGARAMLDSQRPKYLNTADNELYHKREVLFGIDLARAPAARSSRMILVEGYTDVLALHQAGLRNAVGIMGTSLTEEQVRGLERVARVLELCLDADRAGQEAMLRASKLAAGRDLELRVVPLPEGTDPAELIERDGADELRARVEASVPFAAFHVERILQRAQLTSAEGRDQALHELVDVLNELPQGVLRDELIKRADGRLALSQGRLAASLAAAAGQRTGARGVTEAGAGPRAPAPPAMIDPAVRNERAFLVLCVAMPAAGRRALAAIDPDEHLTSDPLRRAARHLAGQPELPFTGLDADDDQLARVLADLVARAGRAGEVRPEQLEEQRLILELARLDRAIRRARTDQRTKLPQLAVQRETVKEAIHAVVGELEKAI